MLLVYACSITPSALRAAAVRREQGDGRESRIGGLLGQTPHHCDSPASDIWTEVRRVSWHVSRLVHTSLGTVLMNTVNSNFRNMPCLALK